MQWEIPDIPSKWASIHGKVITVNGFFASSQQCLIIYVCFIIGGHHGYHGMIGIGRVTIPNWRTF